jgi:CHAT domain-containing protein/tetratricopeptide (TPR) repeat protein
MSGPTICQRRQLVVRVSSSLSLFTLALSLLVVTPTVYPQSNTSSPGPAVTQSASIPSLELGKPIEREITGGEVHSYNLTLAVDQYVQFAVDQRGIDLAVWTFDPNGKRISEVDAFRVGEQEAVALLAEVSGTYRIELHTSFPKGPTGRYEIKLTELRPATERDKISYKAGVLIAHAFELERKQTKDDWRKAIQKYEEALPLWHSINDIDWEINTLYQIASAYISLAEKQKAFDFANRAVALAESAVKDPNEEKRNSALKLQAWALDTLGRAHHEFDDRKKAVDLYNQSLLIRKRINDRGGTIVTLNNLAISYQSMGDPRNALVCLTEIRELLKDTGDRAKESSFLNNICVVYENLAEYAKALEFCNQSLSIRRALNDERGTAPVLNSMGNLYGNMSQYESALDSYTQSQAIYEKFGNENGQAIEFNNLGWLYAALGDYEKAIEFYKRSLELFRKLGNQFRQGATLSNIAANYADLEDYKKALEINLEALKIRIAASDIEGEAVTYNNIAGCYSHLGQKQEALQYYKRAVDIHRTRNPRQLATALRNMGGVYREVGDNQKATECLNEAFEITRRIADPSGEAATLSLLAQVERDQRKLLDAKRHIEAALVSVESLRVSLKDQKLRTSFFASIRKYHEVYIDVLMRLHKENPSGGFDVAALKASENARARSLLESLMEAGAEIGRGVDPSLVTREQTLRRLISDKAEQQLRLSGDRTEEQASSIQRDLDTLTTEYEQVQTQIRQSSPRYAALTKPVSLSLQEIQSGLLDQDTALLEYALGDDKSYAFLVSSTSLKTFELPSRNEVEKAARGVYDLVTATDRVVPDETLEQRNRRLDQADSDYPAAAAELSRMLLAPLESELKNKRLLIVGEGILQYVPFGALPEPDNQFRVSSSETQVQSAKFQNPNSKLQTQNSKPLIASHEVITLPSASVLGVLRSETKDRPRATKTIAVFADPVFGAQDPRIGSISKNRPVENPELEQAGDVKRSAEESGLNGFPRLRFSRQEAEQIMRLVPRNNSLEALDFVANKSTATSADLKQYRIVHFATHGLINSRHADLSGIVLSLVDQEGKPQNGFLRLYDIYNMNLSSDLVVLSACQTALGKDIKGEGLVGLTRAFMYAGASRIVASLWKTEDRATAVLMNRFYESLLANNGMSPAAALRKAQLSMWQDKRWRQPRYWAAFTLQGEWK